MGGSNSKIIVIVGPYGCGKSQFIDCLTQKTSWANHGLQLHDQPIRSTKVKLNKDSFVLVDTPGFDEFTRTAEDILEDVYDWLRRSYKNDIKVTGVLYLQNIMDNRLTVPPPSRILKDLFGDRAARQIVFVTTHWDQAKIAQGERREAQIQRRLEPLLMAGARTARFDMKVDTARGIIQTLLSNLQEEEEAQKREEEERRKREEEKKNEEGKRRREEEERRKREEEENQKREEEEKRRREREEERRKLEEEEKQKDEEGKRRRELEEEERRKLEEEEKQRDEEGKRRRELEEEERRRREEEEKRRREDEERQKRKQLVQSTREDRDEWGSWQGDVESDEAGAKNPATDDQNEEDFEVEEDAMEPEVIPRNETESGFQQKIIDDPVEEASKEVNAHVRCQEPNTNHGVLTAEQEVEIEKSAWGTWIAPQKNIFVTKRICGCCIIM